MPQDEFAELGPNWRPLSRSFRVRLRRSMSGLAVVVITSASLVGIMVITFQVISRQAGIMAHVVSLFGITAVTAIVLRHEADIVSSNARRPGISGPASSFFIGVIGILGALFYWQAAPLHLLFPLVPLNVSVPISVIISVLALVFLADIAINIESRFFGNLEHENLLLRTQNLSHLPTASVDADIDIERLRVLAVKALNHSWLMAKYRADAVEVRQALLRAMNHRLRNQVFRYCEKLVALYEQDILEYLIKYLGETLYLRPRRSTLEGLVIHPLSEYSGELGERSLLAAIWLNDTGLIDGLWVGIDFRNRAFLMAQVGEHFLEISRLDEGSR